LLPVLIRKWLEGSALIAARASSENLTSPPRYRSLRPEEARRHSGMDEWATRFTAYHMIIATTPRLIDPQSLTGSSGP
jgi:hypothetical protein